MINTLGTHIRLGALLLVAALIPSPATLASDRLLVLGDSISAAYGFALEEGWVALLQQELNTRELGVEVINASISGETSDGVRRRLPHLLEKYAPDWVVVEIGGNDGLRGFPLTRLAENLDTIVSQSVDSGAQVLLLGMQIPPNYGRRYTEGFAALYPELADRYQIPLVPFFLDGVAGIPERMQRDGIHPRAEAQADMMANVLPDILLLLQRTPLARVEQ